MRVDTFNGTIVVCAFSLALITKLSDKKLVRLIKYSQSRNICKIPCKSTKVLLLYCSSSLVDLLRKFILKTFILLFLEIFKMHQL